MIGGMLSSTVLTLLVIPVLYVMWRGFQHRKDFREYAKADAAKE
jgi:Cu/Ag efflux pump CusA